jgi:hypothetical protein
VIPADLKNDLFDPGLEAEGLEPVGLIDEGVPGVATGLDDGLLVGPDLEGEEALPKEQPDAFDRVALRGIWRLLNEGDVFRHTQGCGGVPSGAIKDQHGMLVVGQRFGEVLQKALHDLGADSRHDEGKGITGGGLDGGEQIGPVEALIAQAWGPLALGPPPMA